MGLILFPPCFTTISGGLTLDRSTGELSVVRELSPRAVIIDIGTTAMSRAVDHVIVSVVSSSSIRSRSYSHWRFFVLFVWCTVVYAHGRTYIDVSFSCLYGVPLVFARGRTHIDRALAWLRGVPFMFSTLILCRLVCMVYRCVRTRSYLHWRVLLLFVWCTVSVRTRSYSHW